MINSLYIRNFKGIRWADVRLERLTVIVGPNASGKTSFLEGLHHLSRVGSEDPKKFLQNRLDPLLLYRRTASGDEMELSCSGPQGKIRLRIAPPATFPDDLLHPSPSPDEWAFHVEGKEDIGATGDWHILGEIPAVARVFRPADLLRLDASIMAGPSWGAPTRMKPNGQGLASVLANIALNQPEEFQRIQQRLKKVVPTVERIRFDRSSVKKSAYEEARLRRLARVFARQDIEQMTLFEENDDIEESIIFDFDGSIDIPAHLASEGTILVLGLLAALMGRGRPNLVLLDDLDRGLHPRAQREVVGLLRTVLDQNPELQIVATTHSPYLVDSLKPAEGRLTTLDDEGTVSIAGLVDHPDFDKWKDEMAPGEMWSLFGEKWVSEVNKVVGGE